LLVRLIMLFSPSRWLSLPKILALHGTVPRDYADSVLGRLEIRFIGLVIVGVISFGLWSIFQHSQVSALPIPNPPSQGIERGAIRIGICMVTCLGGVVCGTLMGLRPKWWCDEFFPQQRLPSMQPESRLTIERALRILAFPFFGFASYLAWKCF
jgi:hypothetical protein